VSERTIRLSAPIQLVLDASAVRAYPDIDVGEPLTQVTENGGVFVIPLPCLVEARDGDVDAITLLLRHPTFRPVHLPFEHWRQLATMTDVLGRFDTASALLVATTHRCHILTGRPDWYAELGDDPPIIVF
jgi:hypothetical protein